jgi:hypothetical protein
VSCDLPADAALEARLAGAVDAELHWRGPDMDCEGMQRPGGEGIRLAFTGSRAGERLTLVFGIRGLGEGAAGRAVPVNVTLIREGGAVYGTRGDDKCMLDEVRQSPLAAPADAAARDDARAPRRWRVEARGFCLEPARSIGDPRDAILLATFDFRGQLTWDPDPPETTPLTPPAAPPPAAR